MKKLILLVAAVLSMSVVANAQNAQVRFGLKGGLNMAGANDNPYSQVQPGFNAGVLLQIRLAGSRFAIQPEVLYSLQGEQEKFSGELIKFHLNYINIPVMLQCRIVRGLDIECGPQVGFLASAKAKIEALTWGMGEQPKESVNVTEQMHDVYFCLGIGLAYQVPDVAFGLFTRYNLGLTDMTKKQYVGPGEIAGQNRVLQLGIFFRF